MIPGVISTGLESWGTANISRLYFRKRLWGSWTMMKALVLDKEVWKKHIMLDFRTGLDPPNVKLRAAQGFDATDFFITGYWIWNKIFENLASIGYDPTNSFTAAYDWRLSYANLEVRDQYFSRLKAYIEIAVKSKGQKVVLASHSMGSQVLFYFFHWVQSDMGGAGGQDWVELHVGSWINISGCMLGAVKSLTAVLSGEMRDTAQLNAFAIYGLEKFLSKEERGRAISSDARHLVHASHRWRCRVGRLELGAGRPARPKHLVRVATELPSRGQLDHSSKEPDGERIAELSP